MSWEKGFEAGVAFTLRHLDLRDVTPTDISHFIMQLEHLRTWKVHNEWRELVEKNISSEGRDA